MPLSADEKSLLVVAPLFITALFVWAWVVHERGKRLFRMLAERLDADLWQSLGAPATVRQAMSDPARRWRRFLQTQEYRRRCPPDVVELIDDYRGRGNRMLILFGIAAVLLFVRYWELLKPDFL